METFNPDRLKEIRILRELTLEQVAARIDVTKQMVSKYETGISVPTNETLVQMARLFGVHFSYFRKSSMSHGSACSALFFRTTTNTPSKKVESARTRSRWSYEIVDGIHRLWGGLSANLPTWDTSCSIIERARLLREYWGLGTAPIGDLTGILEANRVFVMMGGDSRTKTDGYSQLINGVPIIVINDTRGSAVRRRFSIAHELGHLILHKNLLESEYKLKQELYESEANLFANHLLLSPTGFGEMVESANLDHFIELKKIWKVSVGAMMRHCIDSGIMPQEVDHLKNSFYRRFGRATEPLDDSLPPEQPSLLANTLSMNIVDKDSFDAFYRLVRLPMREVESLTGVDAEIWENYYMQERDWTLSPRDDSGTYQQLSLFVSEV